MERRDVGMAGEFCENDDAEMVRECPDCIDKYIALAERIRTDAQKMIASLERNNAQAREFIKSLILAHKATKSEDHYQITGDARRFIGMD